jgi:hypothetical protein
MPSPSPNPAATVIPAQRSSLSRHVKNLAGSRVVPILLAATVAFIGTAGSAPTHERQVTGVGIKDGSIRLADLSKGARHALKAPRAQVQRAAPDGAADAVTTRVAQRAGVALRAGIALRAGVTCGPASPAGRRRPAGPGRRCRP